jgi:cellobiose phosphorylase
MPLEPRLARRQILLHAEQQFPDGTVHHWWHPHTKIGAVTHFSDDLLWLPYLTMNYLDETADDAILDEVTPFLPAPGRLETEPVEKGTLYEHCVRSIERVYKRWSPRGLPLIGEGDWNDGLSHVGLKWKGESIWLGHFYYGILVRFADVAESRRDKARAQEYRQRAAELKDAINKYAWDGAWYICATRDDGRPLGSHTQTTGKIHLNPQTWALINGTASPERASIAMESARKHLYKNYGPLLLTPAYNEVDPSIGYITRYAPAIRENGGVYTHGATWAIQAECMVGNGDLAHDLYRRMCPILRGQDPDLYYAEPYVTPGNVDGPDSPNYGRGGWTWYTGSAAWLFKVAMDWILGVRATREGLKIDPCIPKEWKKYTVRRKFRGAIYEIEVTNPQNLNRGVKSIRVDGKLLEQPVIPPHKDGRVHQVKVVLGR